MFCPYCGKEVSNNGKTCTACGYEFQEEDDIELRTSYSQKIHSYPVEVDKRDQEIEELKHKVRILEEQAKLNKNNEIHQTPIHITAELCLLILWFMRKNKEINFVHVFSLY